MSYQSVPEVHPDETEHRRSLARTLNNVMLGRVNNASQVSLLVGETETVLTREEIGAFSIPILSPLNQAAAQSFAAGVVWATCADGALTIHHDASSEPRTFAVAYFG